MGEAPKQSSGSLSQPRRASGRLWRRHPGSGCRSSGKVRGPMWELCVAVAWQGPGAGAECEGAHVREEGQVCLTGDS